MAVEPVDMTARSVHMDALREAGSPPAAQSRVAREVLAASACLIALVALLAVRASDGAHPIYTRHAVVITASADQSSQVRAAQPLAVVTPAAVQTPFVTTLPEVAAQVTHESVPTSSARTRGPPGTV